MHDILISALFNVWLKEILKTRHSHHTTVNVKHFLFFHNYIISYFCYEFCWYKQFIFWKNITSLVDTYHSLWIRSFCQYKWAPKQIFSAWLHRRQHSSNISWVSNTQYEYLTDGLFPRYLHVFVALMLARKKSRQRCQAINNSEKVNVSALYTCIAHYIRV